jgi:electron transfer flavoprotein beta subunit
MKIVACYKSVLDEADIRTDPVSRKPLTDRARRKISDYDRNAIECAVSLAEELGASSHLLTAGTGEARSTLKDALSRGPDSAYFFADDAMAVADSSVAARVLASALKVIGDVDLVVCGEGSSDNYAQQVGPRLGQLLGLPVVTCVMQMSVKDGVARCERNLDDGVEVVEVSLPAVVTVLPSLNAPRLAGLKQIVAASKKPVQDLNMTDLGLGVDDLAPRLKRLDMSGTTSTRRNITLTGNAAEIVAEIVKVFEQEELI